MRSYHQRRQAQMLGQRAETLACWYLRLKGYRILARDYKTPVGEIDIIACRGRVLAFVEVKQRKSRAAGLESISMRQQQRIARAAEAYLMRHPDLATRDVRFDVITMTHLSWPHHVPGAWLVDLR